MTIRVGESGKTIRVATGVNMAAFTALLLRFERPNGSNVDKSDPDVTCPAAQIVDPTLGTLAASTYLEYVCVSTDFDVAGTWQVTPQFTNTTPTPDQIFIGATTSFEVLAGLPA
jgi:hypothetical protein